MINVKAIFCPFSMKQLHCRRSFTLSLIHISLIFSSIGILANYVLFGPLHIPFAGSLWLMNAVTVLFILSLIHI